MDKETLKALKGSIRKWKKIEKGKGVDEGPDNCPLCGLFHETNCVYCPVNQKTGYMFCAKTPFSLWDDHQTDFHDNHIPFKIVKGCKKCKTLAHKEVEFLESLLPQGEQ